MSSWRSVPVFPTVIWREGGRKREREREGGMERERKGGRETETDRERGEFTHAEFYN